MWRQYHQVPGYADYVSPRVLLSGESDGLPVAITARPELAPGVGRRLEAVITFTDAVGRRWRRVGSDLPVRVRVDPTASEVAEAAALKFRAGGLEWYRIDS